MTFPFSLGGQQAVRFAMYLYYPDGSSAVAEGTDLRVDTEMDYGGQMIDIQAAPELSMRPTPLLRLKIYPPASGRPMLLVTKRPPIPSE